ncbi:MAG: T9SS type A sorting domain-containing protein [Bacteroidetes bacterium]|nr:T9SS type A sorting domain-containing protein [Bacteroidota bacterium]
MKKTYTAFIVFTAVFLMFQYGKLTATGSGSCTRHGMYGALNNNPTTCANACHGGVGGGGVIVDSASMVDTTGSNIGADTTHTITGMADIAFRAGLNVYPTVTTGRLCIATMADSKDMLYSIYTLDGRMVGSGYLPEYASVTYLDVKALAPAQYIVRVANGEHGASYHIIKQ